jgi:hypothetical protein
VCGRGGDVAVIVVVQGWVRFMAALNAALYLRDILEEVSMQPEVAELEAVLSQQRRHSAVRSFSLLSLGDGSHGVADLGRLAISGVSQVTSGLST